MKTKYKEDLSPGKVYAFKMVFKIHTRPQANHLPIAPGYPRLSVPYTQHRDDLNGKKSIWSEFLFAIALWNITKVGS